MAVRLIVEDGPYAGVSRADVARRARAMLDAVQMQHGMPPVRALPQLTGLQVVEVQAHL